MKCLIPSTAVFLVLPLLISHSHCLGETSAASSVDGGPHAVATPAGTPNATGTATVDAIPLPQSGTADYESPWTLTLSVFENSRGRSYNRSFVPGQTTGLDLSWPVQTSDLPYGDVCMLWMLNFAPTFAGLDASAAGSGDCSALLGSECARDLGEAALQWGLETNCTSSRTNYTNIFRGFPTPESCQSINDSPNVRTVGMFNPPNKSATISYFEPTDATNKSTVFNTTVHRVWPVFLLEQKQGPDNTTGSAGNLGCVQALNVTNAVVSGGGDSRSASSTDGTPSPTGTGTGASSIPTGSAARSEGAKGLILTAVILRTLLLY